MVQHTGVTVAQVQVPADTTETTQVRQLLNEVPTQDGDQVVITADAAHTQRATAEYIAGERGCDYVLTVKANQPALLTSVFNHCLPLLRQDPDHVVTERARGRISEWSTWITDATGVDFPHIKQVACIRRNIYTTAGTWIRKEHAWIITSGDPSRISAADVHTYVRHHWRIENKSHYVRDTVWREDTQQIYTGSGPQVMATLRNLALGVLRLNGINTIKETTEQIARDRTRAPHYSLPNVATRYLG
jgi:predicted transposase YbfD/YdcC